MRLSWNEVRARAAAFAEEWKDVAYEFWPGVLVVEQKSAGRDLKKAYGQAIDYLLALPERDHPRYILVSDFQTFELHDLDERETVSFALAELPRHVEAFGFILGVQRRAFRDQDPANVKAAELVGRLHDALHEGGYRDHDLERLPWCGLPPAGRTWSRRRTPDIRTSRQSDRPYAGNT